MLLNKFYFTKYLLGLMLSFATWQIATAQNDCGSALTVTDLTGTVCASGAASSSDNYASGCVDGTADTWFSFTAQGPNADITVTSSTTDFGPEITIVESSNNTCGGALSTLTCFDGANNGRYEILNATLTGGLVAGETYWIVVTSDNGFTTGTLDVCVDNPAAAPGDDPCDAIPLALGSACSFTNADNTGMTETFGSSPSCGLYGPDIWFSFTVPASGIIDISTQAGGITDGVMAVWAAATCAGPFTEEACNDDDAGLMPGLQGVSLTPGTTAYVSFWDFAGGTEGTFDICITEVSVVASCVDNQECTSPEVIALAASGSGAACVTDCNNNATPGPDFTGNNCYDFPNETVWYEITTDANAATLDIDLTSADLSDPEFTLFTTADCSNYTIINCQEGTGGTASAAGLGITANTTYLIAVSDATGDQGNFQLCVTQNPDNSSCNIDNTLQATSTSLGSPVGGPYQPGEIVTFCYTINSYVTGLPSDPQGCNYISGIVPTFGDCWDPVSFTATGEPLSVTTPLATEGVISDPGNDCSGPPGGQPAYCACLGDPAGQWNWYADGIVDYNLNNANPLGLSAGDPVGAGWFFTTNYDSPGGACTPETNPNDSYGDNNFPACDDLGGWQVCFQLQAKDAIACGAGETDCSVTVKTFADGEVGVWSNVGCTADQPTNAPATMTCVLLSTDIEAFIGRNAGEFNKIEWTVSDASLVKEFQLEKSMDAVSWESLATIEGRDPQLTYNYQDLNPFNMLTYYRLKVLDHNGELTYSNVISIASNNNPNTGLVSDIYPNPTKDRFFFNYTGNDMDTPVNVQVVNTIGQIVEAYEVNLTDPNELFEVNTSRYNEGVYIVNITQGPLKMVKRISVMR